MYRNRPVSLALVGLFVWVTGCTSYTQIGIGDVADHGKVRVTTTDGERETIRDPELDGDAVKGLERDERRVRVIPVDSVATVESLDINWVKTAGLTVFAVAGTLFVVAMYKGAKEWSDTVDSINRSLD